MSRRFFVTNNVGKLVFEHRGELSGVLKRVLDAAHAFGFVALKVSIETPDLCYVRTTESAGSLMFTITASNMHPLLKKLTPGRWVLGRMSWECPRGLPLGRPLGYSVLYLNAIGDVLSHKLLPGVLEDANKRADEVLATTNKRVINTVALAAGVLDALPIEAPDGAEIRVLLKQSGSDWVPVARCKL